MSRRRVLVLYGYYLPAQRAGGVVASLRGLAHLLRDSIEFSFLVGDRDLDGTPLMVERGSWVTVEGRPVRYLSPSIRDLLALPGLVEEEHPDWIYFASIFSAYFTLIPLLLFAVLGWPRAQLMVSPRGALAPTALALRPWRKRLALALYRLSGLAKRIVWHASNELEAGQIRAWLGSSVRVRIAADPPTVTLDDIDRLSAVPRPPKEQGQVRVMFLGRIAPIKNLHTALRVLAGARCQVDFEVIGPVEDQPYWEACEEEAARLPLHVTWHHSGVLPPGEAGPRLASAHLLFLPSRGESFGHVLLEALAAGTPVLTSTETPWTAPIQGRCLGWCLPPEDVEAMARAIEKAGAWSQSAFEAHAGRCRQFARDYLREGHAAAENLRLFA